MPLDSATQRGGDVASLPPRAQNPGMRVTPTPDRVVVVSDVHLAPLGPLSNFRAHGPFARFLGAVASPETLIVLNGDTLDTLQLPGRSPELPVGVAARHVESLLDALEDERDHGCRVLEAWRAAITRGARFLYVPGNHEAEFFEKPARAVLAARLGLTAGDPRLQFHTEPGFAEIDFPTFGVRLAHGHETDDWNRILDADFAAARPDGIVSLPPGSRLVLGLLNDFKNAGHPYVDALKPESPGVPLLLFYFDRGLVLARGGDFARILWTRICKSVADAFLGRAPAPAVRNAADPGSLDWLAQHAVALDGVRSAEGDAKSVAEVAAAVDGPPPQPDRVHDGGFQRILRRMAVLALSRGGEFFNERTIDGVDEAIIAHHVPSGAAPAVLVAGHTHAARQFRFGPHLYLNTGTWTDLLQFPDVTDDAAVIEFLTHIKRVGMSGRSEQRLRYVIADANGARLESWR